MGKRGASAVSKVASAPVVQEVLQTKKQKLEVATSSLNTLDMKRITEIMDSKGATLPAVLLKQDGTAVEVSFDTTPRLKEVNRIVGCDAHENITFAGQWEDVVDEGDSVLLILRGKAEDLNLPANKNKLQPPFHEAEIPGDILLQRSDEEGNVLDFTLKQYKAFQKKVIKEWVPADDDAEGDDEEEDEEEEATGSEMSGEEDEEDDEESEEEEGEEEEEMEALNAAQIDPKVAQAKLLEFLQDYAKKHNGAMPSDEELNTIKGTIYYMLALEASGGDAFGEEDEEEEEEEVKVQTKKKGKGKGKK